MAATATEELFDLRRELRELRLIVGAIADRVVPDLEVRVLNYRYRNENPLGKGWYLPSRAQQRIGEALGLPIPTLQDLALIPREVIAAIEGVGPKAMDAIDAAMAEHGLSWAEAS